MFILITVSDLIQISPQDFQKPSAEAIEDNINSKYANKVIQKVGLCICMYDLLKSSDGLIGHGTGIVNVNVEFRLIVFRPFRGEIILGKISSSSVDGVKIRLDFFDDILIPHSLLFDGCRFDHNEQTFIYPTPDGDLYLDRNESVRFRVEAEEWVDQSPMKATALGAGSAVAAAGLEERKSPYSIKASMGQSGLGPCIWWD